METLGIDVSVDPKRTVACRIEWTEGRARVAAPMRPVADQLLVALCSSGRPCGVDVPLGWPMRFVEAVVAHQQFSNWPADVADDRLMFRTTDRWILQQTGIHPLSVSTDRIGRTALPAGRTRPVWGRGSWPAGVIDMQARVAITADAGAALARNDPEVFPVNSSTLDLGGVVAQTGFHRTGLSYAILFTYGRAAYQLEMVFVTSSSASQRTAAIAAAESFARSFYMNLRASQAQP